MGTEIKRSGENEVVIIASAACSTVVESSFMLVAILDGLVESSGPTIVMPIVPLGI